jgi:hypothetical protein
MSDYGSVTTDDLEQRARLQQRHYELFSELQTMSSQLPMQYQQRLPYELLSSLASCLLDDTVPQIVRGLKEIQAMLEKSLFERRNRQVEHLRACRTQLRERNREAIALRTMTAKESAQKEREMDLHVQEETRKLDMRIVAELDQNVAEQQNTLDNAGLPAFHLTTKPIDVRIQMYLIDFILRISDKQAARSSS